MAQGILIALDGLDGSGKETQSRLLCSGLSGRGIENRLVSFPTYREDCCALVRLYLSGAFGDDPAAVNAYAASSFYAADRYCSYMLDWKKDCEAGKVVVANRYVSANLVHQMSKLPREKWDGFIDWVQNYEFGLLGLPVPDLVLYLCVPPEHSARLIQSRCEKTGASMDIHEKNAEFLGRSYEAALYAAEKCGWRRIDCVRDGVLRGIDDINAEVCAEAEKTIGKRSRREQPPVTGTADGNSRREQPPVTGTADGNSRREQAERTSDGKQSP